MTRATDEPTERSDSRHPLTAAVAPKATEGRSPATLSLGPIDRGEGLVERAAELILQQIIDLGLEPGDRLPSVRELELHMRASRTVVREAIRSLAGRGIVRVQPGHGLFVAQANGSATRASVNLLLRGSIELRYDKVKEMRGILEVPIAGLAATRATREDLAAISAALDSQAGSKEDLGAVATADVGFHLGLARATHNELFSVLLEAMSDILIETVLLTIHRPGGFKQGVEDHRRILAAVEARNTVRARRLMRDHLANSEALMQQVDRPLRHVLEPAPRRGSG